MTTKTTTNTTTTLVKEVGADKVGMRRPSGVCPQGSCRASNLPRKACIEDVIDLANLREAAKAVVKRGREGNYKAPGVDGFTPQQLEQDMEGHIGLLRQMILEGNFRWSKLKPAKIPKGCKGSGKGTRTLKLPTVMDRVLARSIHQVLEPRFERSFSISSFGFRKKKSAQKAVLRYQELARKGWAWVVEIDIEKFYDCIDHDLLKRDLAPHVDPQLLRLICGHLFMSGRKIGENGTGRWVGIAQGSPLSPLLGNLVLNNLDHELDRRKLRFTRFADDLRILVRSKKAADRVMKVTSNYLREKLKLKVGPYPEKSQVDRFDKIPFLGYQVTEELELVPSEESIKDLDQKIEDILRDPDLGRKELEDQIQGWLGYFALAKDSEPYREVQRRAPLWLSSLG